MIHRPNRYASNCYYCKQLVPEMQGWLRRRVKTMTDFGSNFIVVCKPCFDKNRNELHPKNEVPFVGEWDKDKSPRKHLLKEG